MTAFYSTPGGTTMPNDLHTSLPSPYLPHPTLSNGILSSVSRPRPKSPPFLIPSGHLPLSVVYLPFPPNAPRACSERRGHSSGERYLDLNDCGRGRFSRERDQLPTQVPVLASPRFSSGKYRVRVSIPFDCLIHFLELNLRFSTAEGFSNPPLFSAATMLCFQPRRDSSHILAA